MSNDSLCPCGSTLPYSRCCGEFIEGDRNPATAEQLMRSRYTAYVRGATAYLEQTWHRSTRPRQITHDGAVHWNGLKILHVHAGGADDNEGTVAFVAEYSVNGTDQRINEISRFIREQGRWIYLDALVKQGRNDPCACGSGKKYKKCCGKAAT